MKLAPDEKAWAELAKAGRLNDAHKEYLATEGSRWIAIRRLAYHFTRLVGAKFVRIVSAWLPGDNGELVIDLSPEYLFFYKDIDTVGFRLFKKIIGHFLVKRKSPIRACVWFAHWLVFEGEYVESARLFAHLNKRIDKDIRLKAEIYTFLGNYFYVRGQVKLSDRYNEKCHKLCVHFDDKVVQTFNIGQWIRIATYNNSLEHMQKVLACFDGMNPQVPDERYGLRVLCFTAYVYFVNGEYALADHFIASAESVYSRSGSELEKSISILPSP